MRLLYSLASFCLFLLELNNQFELFELLAGQRARSHRRTGLE